MSVCEKHLIPPTHDFLFKNTTNSFELGAGENPLNLKNVYQEAYGKYHGDSLGPSP